MFSRIFISGLVIGSLFLAAVMGIFIEKVAQPTSQSPQALGGTFTPAMVPQTTLSGAGVTSSQTTVPLVSLLTRDGRPVLMSMLGSIGYATLEPGSSKEEIISFTGITQNTNGSATLTGAARGLDFVFPYAASSTLQKSHAGGAIFIISNSSPFYGQQFLFANSLSTSTSILTFSSTTPPRYDSDSVQKNGTFIATTSEFASIDYVNAIAFSGAPTASEGAKGISQLATAAQQASSTITGSAGPLVSQARYATDTPQSGCNPTFTSTKGAGCSVIANLLGVINPQWLATSSLYSYNWGAANIFQASTTLSATTTIAANSTTTRALVLNTLAYAFPPTRAASGTVLSESGGGNLTWERPDWQVIASSTITSSVASTTLSNIPASSDLHVVINVPAPGGTNIISLQFNADTGADYSWGYLTDAAAKQGAGPVTVIRLSQAQSGGFTTIMDILNQTANVKVLSWADTNYPLGTFENGHGVWTNSSAQISSITIGSGPGANLPAGTRITVYGSTQ